MTISRTFAVIACFGLFLTHTGCSGNSFERNGPLSAGGDVSELCMVQPPRGAAAIGGIVENKGNTTVILKDISLIDANNLELLDHYVFPMDGENDFVLGAGSTQPDDPQHKDAWATAQQPGAFEVPPGDTASIAVAVDNTSDVSGTAKAIRVTYSVDGRQYIADTTTTIELAATTCF